MTHAFRVVQAFKARTAISDRERQFNPGDVVLSDVVSGDDTITIEAGRSFFLVERSTFEACCERIRTPQGE